jgi:hypothetical protein
VPLVSFGREVDAGGRPTRRDRVDRGRQREHVEADVRRGPAWIAVFGSCRQRFRPHLRRGPAAIASALPTLPTPTNMIACARGCSVVTDV